MPSKTTIQKYDISPSIQSLIKGVQKKSEVKTDQQIINDMIVDYDKEKKEKVLLEHELTKPPNKRNKTLLNKYLLYTEQKIDDYPDVHDTDRSYSITEYFPDDTLIPTEYRQDKWKVSLFINDVKGNNYEFIFHFHRHKLNDSEIVYKLDNMDVYIDERGDVIKNISSYDIYNALQDFKKTRELNLDIENVFNQYGINTDNLCIRSHNISVYYTTIKKTIEEIRNEKEINEKEKLINKSMIINSYDFYTEEFLIEHKEFDLKVPGDNKNKLELYKKFITTTPNIKLIGIDDKISDIENKFLIEKVFFTEKAKSISKTNFYGKITYNIAYEEDKEEEFPFLLEVASGLSMLHKLTNNNKNTKERENLLAKNNSEQYEIFKEKNKKIKINNCFKNF